MRRSFALAGASVTCGWSVTGLFASLVPSLVRTVLHIDNLAVGGLIVFLQLASATVVPRLLSELSNRVEIIVGLVLLAAGGSLIAVAAIDHSLSVLVVGALLTGAGNGLTFRGSLAAVNRLAPKERRGQVISSYFVVAYIGVCVPTLGMGIAAQQVGLQAAAVYFAVGLGILSLGCMAAVLWRERGLMA